MANDRDARDRKRSRKQASEKKRSSMFRRDKDGRSVRRTATQSYSDRWDYSTDKKKKNRMRK